jgi:hypothetical protein
MHDDEIPTTVQYVKDVTLDVIAAPLGGQKIIAPCVVTALLEGPPHNATELARDKHAHRVYTH